MGVSFLLSASLPHVKSILEISPEFAIMRDPGVLPSDTVSVLQPRLLSPAIQYYKAIPGGPVKDTRSKIRVGQLQISCLSSLPTWQFFISRLPENLIATAPAAL